MRKKNLFWILPALVALTAFTGCSDDDGGTNPEPTPVDQFETVRTALATYLALGSAPTMSAEAVHTAISADTAPTVLSVRTAAHYALGHVPGAMNIPWREIASPAQLALLPTDGSQIVVYCYTGHTGGVATTVLNALGYNAVNMKHGMSAWTTDATIRATTPFGAADEHDYDVETAANEPADTYDHPVLDLTSSEDSQEIVRAAAEAYVSDAATSATITAEDVHAHLGDPEYFIVSVRSAEHYALGHIPGAINIPWREIADADQLARIPADKKIVVYCYTGHTGAIATTCLQMLGYDAYNMKYGMCAWTTDATVRATAPFGPSEEHDYPTEP